MSHTASRGLQLPSCSCALPKAQPWQVVSFLPRTVMAWKACVPGHAVALPKRQGKE